jgi:hypothetical protein
MPAFNGNEHATAPPRVSSVLYAGMVTIETKNSQQAVVNEMQAQTLEFRP